MHGFEDPESNKEHIVLTMGDARPLQNVGGLTAVAMIVAALATFWAIPALAGRASYGGGDAPSPHAPLNLSTDLEVPSAEGDALAPPSSPSASGRDR